MKDAPHYLKDLARIVEPAPPAEEAARRRAALIAGIDRSTERVSAMVKARRRGRIWLSGVVVAAAAAGALLAFGGRVDSRNGISPADRHVAAQPSAQAQHAAAPEVPKAASRETPSQSLVRGPIFSEQIGKVDPGHELGEGLLIVGTDQPALIRLASGAQMEAEAGSKLRLRTSRSGDVLEEAVVLGLGGVALEVPHLGKQRRLLVETEEAVVEVRGTAFRVERTNAENAADAMTRVTVSEGLVSVRSGGSEVFLRPGDRWESGGSAKGAVRSEPIRMRTEQPAVAPPASEVPSANLAPVSPASQLAEQNELYHSAVLASRNGFVDLARVRFEQLLRQYPNSPLAQGARRELERLGRGTPSKP